MRRRSLTVARVLVLAVIVGVTCPRPAVCRADSSLALPLALVRGAPAPAVSDPLPAHDLSPVLADAPVPPGAALVYFEDGAFDRRPDALALHAIPDGTALPGGLAAWYRRLLPTFRWRLQTATPDGDFWRRGGEWLDVRAAALGGGLVRLRRDPRGVAPTGNLTLDGIAPLPSGVALRRYDSLDLYPEEVRATGSVSEAAASALAAMAHAGWQAEPGIGLGRVTLVRFVRGDERVVIAVRPVDSGQSELAVGSIDCLDARGPVAGWPDPPAAVYLDDLPAPPESSIDSYEQRRDDDRATERWRGRCLDLDLFAALYQDRLTTAGWHFVPTSVRREPGGVSFVARPAGAGPAVTVVASADGRGSASIALERAVAGRRVPTDEGLLFADLPVPAGADAVRLETRTEDGWTFRETYVLPPGSGVEVGRFYRTALGVRGWAFERTEPADGGAGLVHFRDGEELLVRFPAQAEDAPAVSLARRRVCPSDRAQAPADAPLPSPHLLEMPVPPGAVLESFADGRERHAMSCTGLDLVADWYRAVMTRGDWALATTVGPDDPLHRELLFVRPAERGLPPEQRTAWAEIRLDRVWPYHYVVTLARDPEGLRPCPAVP